MPLNDDASAYAEPLPEGSSAPTLESALSASLTQQDSAVRGWSMVTGRPFGLRSWLLSMLAIGLLPAMAGTVWYLGQLREVAVRDAFAQADLVARGTAESLRWLMQDAQAMMASVAARPKVKALDAGDCDPIFHEFHDLSPAFRALSLRRLDGSSLCSNLQQPPSQQGVFAAAWFQAAVVHDGFYASDAHIGAITQTWTARLTLPVKGLSGQTQALLISPVDLKQLQQRLFGDAPSGPVVAVVDAANKVVVRSLRQDERVGKQAADRVARILDEMRQAPQGRGSAPSRQFVEVGVDNVRRLFAVVKVPLTDWCVVAALPEEETLSAYYDSRNRALLAFSAILLLAVLAAWRVSRGILVPINGLARAARGVGGGDPSWRAPQSGPREIGEVAREFNRMVVATAEAGERLRASESHYRTLIQNLPVAVVSHRADSAIEVFNDRACLLLRMTPEQMEGKTASDRAWFFVDAQGRRLTPDDYPVSRVLRSRQPLPPEMLGIVAEGPAAAQGADPVPELRAHTWVMVTGYPQFDELGQLARVIVVFVDVSAQRHADELLVAKEAAEAASQAKSAFLSRVSHELRTPLNAINGFSELMLMDPQVPAEVKSKVQHVFNAGRHLLSLINQILDLTRIEAGQVRTSIQPLGLWPMLEECVAICGPLAQGKDVTLHLNPLPGGAGKAGQLQVSTDALLLRQILMNLLSNAIKYNRPQGRVTVDVQTVIAADGARTVVVEVTDTGIGLSTSDLDRLFLPFNRLSPAHAGTEGHGLGLAISRQLARALNGDITVRSAVGQGSTFALHLPAD